MKRLLNVSQQIGNLGEQLEVLSELVVTQPVAALKRLTLFSEQLLPKYKRKFKDTLLDEQEKELLEEEWGGRLQSEDLEEHLRLILEDIDAEFNNNRNMMKNLLLQYNKEPKYNFGNRVLELCDMIAGSFQSGLSKEHIYTVLEFVSYELQKISRVVGNDY